MSEHVPKREWGDCELVDKPLEDMTYEEQVAWYLQYMKTVPEENIMMVSGMPLEIEDNRQAFRAFVRVHQQMIREGIA